MSEPWSSQSDSISLLRMDIQTQSQSNHCMVYKLKYTQYEQGMITDGQVICLYDSSYSMDPMPTNGTRGSTPGSIITTCINIMSEVLKWHVGRVKLKSTLA